MVRYDIAAIQRDALRSAKNKPLKEKENALVMALNFFIHMHNDATLRDEAAKYLKDLENAGDKDVPALVDQLIETTQEKLNEVAMKGEEQKKNIGGRRTSKISKKFDKCVKKVRRTVKARKGSNKESAAIAICTTSVLHPRGKTLKRYRKGRLTTQKKLR